MKSPRKQYSYFESLENTVKIAFAVYLVFFAAGMILTLLGAANVLTFLQTHSIIFWLVACMFVFTIFFVLLYLIGKVNWLGDLHIRLDRQFFGFLEKSNDSIFHSLISTFEAHEQERLYR